MSRELVIGLFEQNMFIYVMLGLCTVGILIKFVLAKVYKTLVKASENVGTSKNKLIQSMKKKFEAFYKLKIGVNNVDIFVDKYILHHKLCGVFLSTWENICGQLLVLTVLIGSISTILGLIYECGKIQILSTFTVSLLTVGLLILLEGILNIGGKRERLRLNIKDYLENYLKIRLEQGLHNPKALEQFKNELKEIGDLREIEGFSSLQESETFMAITNEASQKEKSKKLNNTERKKKSKWDKQRKIAQEKREKRIQEEEANRLKALRKEEKIQKRLEMKAYKIKLKQEAKAAMEEKREAERLEIERIKEEVRKDEERKKEEKSKTIAQEKKEILLKEIGSRREHRVADITPFTLKERVEENIKEVEVESAATREGDTFNLETDKKERLQSLIKTGLKQGNLEEDKVIADILKEFLA